MSNPREGSSTTRKSIWDLDLDDPSSFQVPISTSEATGGAGRVKNKKPRTAHDKDPTYPPTSYTKYAYEVYLQWYAGKSVPFLEANYLRDPSAGSLKLMHDLEARILKKCKESEDFGDMDLTYYSQHFQLFENTIQQCIFNTKQLMLDLEPQTLGYVGDEEAKEFREKMEWWQKAVRKLSNSETRGMKWKNDAVKVAFARDGGSCVTWISPQANVVALIGFDREGGHGKVRKVRIEGMETIPTHIAFAGKMSKARNLRDARVERSVEALSCPLNHPAIINFFAIHARTMEAYTLWWNGGNLLELKRLDRKVLPTVEWHEMKQVRELPEEKQKELTLFRRHKAKLAWALVYVTSLMHQSLVLYNDLSPMNIMLHYPDYSNEVINIGICDWGISSRMDERAPSHYGYPTQVLKEQNQLGRWWVAPELFYAFGPEHSNMSLLIMQATHKYTEQSDSYSIRKLTEWMKIADVVDFDRDLFKNLEGSKYFAMKLGELLNPDPKNRPTCTQVTNLLMGPPWCMKPPEVVFRNSPL